MPSYPPIAYYISGHGFGHAARQQPIIQLLAARGIKIYVRTPVASKFFNAPNVEVHHERYDIGMIQPDSLAIDAEATFRWYADFLTRQDMLIEQEATFIRQQDIRLIVSDMPPIAFEIAAHVGIPSIAITHFTWDWVYEFYIGAFPQYQYIVDSILGSYFKATLALQMPFAHEFSMFRQVEPIPLVINQPTKTRAEIYDVFNIPQNHRVGVLSMGGMEWGKTDISVLRHKHDWTFLVMPGAWEQVRDLPNFRLIPTHYPAYHNLIASADVVVGKAGGSTVAECIAHRVPVIYTLRDDYRENELLHNALCNFANSLLVKKHEFETGQWADLLDEIVKREYVWPKIRSDGAAIAAQRIMDFLT